MCIKRIRIFYKTSVLLESPIWVRLVGPPMHLGIGYNVVGHLHGTQLDYNYCMSWNTLIAYDGYLNMLKLTVLEKGPSNLLIIFS